MSKSITAALALALALAGYGCASESPVRIDPEGEVSFDGLQRVQQHGFDEGWAKPGLDLTGYRKILLEPIQISYREVPATTTHRRRAGGQSDFPIGEQARAQLQDVVRQAFQQELARSDRYELTDEPGRDVLLIRGALLDVVSHVPPEPIGRSDIFLKSIGEATLVLELRDAVTNTILARAIDRRAAERAGLFIELSTVTAWSEVRIVAKGWARLLRKRLDEFTKLGA